MEWRYPETKQEQVKSLTFKELRRRGFFLTSGDKFGADFLAYPGDPLLFHAKFVILCLKNEEIRRMPDSGLVAKCRLGTAVNKVVLLSFVEEGVVKFQRLKWTAEN